MRYKSEDYYKFKKDRRYEVRVYVHSKNVINFYFNDKDYIQLNDYKAFTFIYWNKEYFKFRLLRVRGKNKNRKEQVMIIGYLEIARKRKQVTEKEYKANRQIVEFYDRMRGYR